MIRLRHLRAAAATTAMAAMLAAPAGLIATAQAKVLATFSGKTSQGKAFEIQFRRHGAGAVISFSTSVTGSCPVTGLGNATMSTNVADHAHGALPIPKKWGWETKTASYDIKIRETSKHGKTMRGQLWASWQTNIDNAPTCTTPIINWKAKKK